MKIIIKSGADPGCLKGGGARSASQNLAPPTFYILMARAHAHHMNRTEHEHLSFYEFTRTSSELVLYSLSLAAALSTLYI